MSRELYEAPVQADAVVRFSSCTGSEKSRHNYLAKRP